jgi:hypothetical protein
MVGRVEWKSKAPNPIVEPTFTPSGLSRLTIDVRHRND